MQRPRLGWNRWPVLIVLACPACSLDFGFDASEPATHPGSGLPESRGVTVTHDVHPEALLWSSDGQEVFHLPGPQPRGYPIKAVDVSTRAIRTVATSPSYPSKLRLSADGDSLYFLAHSDTINLGMGLYRVSVDGATPELVLGARHVWKWALSPTNGPVAYAGNDSLFLHDLANGQERLLAASAEPQAFSTDGRRLLFTDWNPDWTPDGPPEYADVTYDLETGESEPVSLGPTRSGRRLLTVTNLEMLRWDRDGIRVLYRRGLESAFIYDVARGTETSLAFDLRESQGDPAFAGAWSDDGTMLAYWSVACLESTGFLFDYQCHRSEYHLHVTSADGRGDRIVVVAYGDGTAWGGPAAFAPDGQRIAYVFQNRIYVQRLP